MFRSGRLTALLAVLILLPSASAVWSVGGNAEPDTLQDKEQDRMWAQPDVNPIGARIYFNGMLTEASGVSPNVGMLGSRIITPTIRAAAWLGIWKDCNHDGYIGHAESVLLEYDPVLLNRTDICPPGSMWNHDGWVSEFIHIGDRSSPANPALFPRVIKDLEVRVWGDFDRPDMFPQPAVACVNAPLARGTLDSTGALLMMVDCNVNYNIARAVNDADALLHLGLAFDGPGGHYRPDTDCDNPLNQQLDLYGDSPCNPDDPGLFEGRTGRRMVDVWDCAARGRQKMVDVRDPTAPPGGRGQLSSIPDPQTGEPRFFITDRDGTYGVPLGNTGGGVWLEVDNGNPIGIGINDTDGSLQDTSSHISDGMGPCAGAESDAGLGEPLLNGDRIFDPLSGKRKQDFTLSFSVGSGASTIVGPPNNGVRTTGAPYTSSESYGPPTKFANGVVRRDDLRPSAANYFTFYASLGGSTLGLGYQPPDTTGARYGAPACGAFTSGVRNGWDCDATHWYNTALGGANNDRGQRPGATYHMIDTDCYDGAIGGGSGLFASTTIVSSDSPCPTVS